MLVEVHFKIVLRIFQSLGLATIPVITQKPNLRNFANHLPVIASAACSFAIIMFLIFYPHFTSSLHTSSPYSPIHSIINFASLVGFLLVALTANFQCYFHRSVYQSDEITMQIRYSPKYNNNAANKIELLKNVKLLHMDLWKLVGQLNVFFGWNLLMLIINSFIYITYQLYWVFLALELKWHSLGMVEGLASLLYGMVSLFVLVNSCQSGTLKIRHLIESIELYAFWTSDNVHLHHLKQEVFSQISYLPIYITGSEFFTIDRKYLAGIAANCCMYIIIFIQFFVSADI